MKSFKERFKQLEVKNSFYHQKPFKNKASPLDLLLPILKPSMTFYQFMRKLTKDITDQGKKKISFMNDIT